MSTPDAYIKSMAETVANVLLDWTDLSSVRGLFDNLRDNPNLHGYIKANFEIRKVLAFVIVECEVGCEYLDELSVATVEELRTIYTYLYDDSETGRMILDEVVRFKFEK